MGVKLVSHIKGRTDTGCLRRTVGFNKEKHTRGWRKIHVEELVSCALHQIILVWSYWGGWHGQVMQHARERWRG